MPEFGGIPGPIIDMPPIVGGIAGPIIGMLVILGIIPSMPPVADMFPIEP
eukprot:CAMPEP_0169141832 /NCGR_PEP_ID=MMETSP1015-20121227/44577_1 /TAXON_ID=342587 /ORGANISM="Karlodinium micrum, Strain CCMP2283" /LENGTH=49 /DNA_ID=CAMNT_0009208359 /DNA_START=239 /DNA_END=388 /DNA_ORIENTATION=-